MHDRPRRFMALRWLLAGPSSPDRRAIARSSRSAHLALVLAALLLCGRGGEAQARPDMASMKRVFAKMKKALRGKNEAQFKKLWHPVGYTKNIVGGSGLPGRSVFKQGSRKGWYLRPNVAKMRGLPGRRGGPWIFPCAVYSWKKHRSVDKVWALLVYQRKLKRWVVLGAGEKLAQVEALGKRFLAKGAKGL